MHAALVTSFDAPPRYTDVDSPEPGPGRLPVRMLAAGLHPRVRSQAGGSHYTSTDELPLIPGIDGVGRTPSGDLVYLVLPDTRQGSMAEWTVVDERRAVPLPPDADPIVLAAAMNPAMSSWVALRRRIDLQPGQSVLVLGATGNAGRLAVQVARHLGAGRVVGAGRDPGRVAELRDLGADDAIRLDDPDALAAAGSDVDVVLDYVWGAVTPAALTAIVPARSDDARPLTWVEVGSVAGREASIPSAALRATRLTLVGSGQGSVATREIVAELGELATAIGSGAFRIDARAVPLAEVESVWDASSPERVVLVP